MLLRLNLLDLGASGAVKKPFSLDNISKAFDLLLGKGLHTAATPTSFEHFEQEGYSFKEHYQAHLFPHVELFEIDRIERLKVIRQRLFISILLTPLIGLVDVLIFQYLRIDSAFDLLFFVTVGAFTGLYFWVSGPTRAYKSAVKTTIFPAVFSYFEKSNIGQFFYTKDSPIFMSRFSPSDIIPLHDNSTLEDYIKGTYKDVTLEMVEARLTQTTGHGKKRRTTVVFKGIFVQLSMNKNFHGHTILKRDFGKIGNWLAGKFTSNGKETVSLEDPVFEKEFEVYSTDQVEARYLLSTSFMERLLKLADAFGSSGLQAAFYDNHLLLMIPSDHDHFEAASIFTPATFEEEIKTILGEMEQLFSIIDILKLDNQTRL